MDSSMIIVFALKAFFDTFVTYIDDLIVVSSKVAGT